MKERTFTVTVAGIDVEVTRKKVKYLRLKVQPPDGRVRMSVPLLSSQRHIHRVIESRLDWIFQHRARMIARPRKPVYDYITGERHMVGGRPCMLNLEETSGRQRVQFAESGIIHMTTKPGSTRDQRRKLLEQGYRDYLKRSVPPILSRWETITGVHAAEWRIRRMKTRWGTCNVRAKRIWLNLELAKYDEQLLEFIILHELTHLLERNHNGRFKQLMDGFMPDWQEREAQLKKAAL